MSKSPFSTSREYKLVGQNQEPLADRVLIQRSADESSVIQSVQNPEISISSSIGDSAQTGSLPQVQRSMLDPVNVSQVHDVTSDRDLSQTIQRTAIADSSSRNESSELIGQIQESPADRVLIQRSADESSVIQSVQNPENSTSSSIVDSSQTGSLPQVQRSMLDPVNVSQVDDVTSDRDLSQTIQRTAIADSSNSSESGELIGQNQESLTDRVLIQRSEDEDRVIQSAQSSALTSNSNSQAAEIPTALRKISILQPLVQPSAHPSLQRSLLPKTEQQLASQNVSSSSWTPIAPILTPSSTASSPTLQTQMEQTPQIHPTPQLSLPEEWSNLEDLVQIQRQPMAPISSSSSSSRPQESHYSNQPPTPYPEIVIQRQSQTHAISAPIPIQPSQDAPSLSKSEYTAIGSHSPQLLDREEIIRSDQFEALAYEIYRQLRARLEIEQERQGRGYSGRLPW